MSTQVNSGRSGKGAPPPVIGGTTNGDEEVRDYTYVPEEEEGVEEMAAQANARGGKRAAGGKKSALERNAEAGAAGKRDTGIDPSKSQKQRDEEGKLARKAAAEAQKATEKAEREAARAQKKEEREAGAAEKKRTEAEEDARLNMSRRKLVLERLREFGASEQNPMPRLSLSQTYKKLRMTALKMAEEGLIVRRQEVTGGKIEYLGINPKPLAAGRKALEAIDAESSADALAAAPKGDAMTPPKPPKEKKEKVAKVETAAAAAVEAVVTEEVEEVPKAKGGRKKKAA